MRALSGAEAWRLRRRTATAMLLLIRARLLIAFVPLRYWRGSLGFAGQTQGDPEQQRETRRLAIHVLRAADRLPGKTLCLPQAMALSAMLRRTRTPHALVFAARPSAYSGEGDRLHAWIEQGGERVIGDLPGPWIETFRAGG
jgi:hypothetical protein